jgi:predicted O-methyltransferase YrrM
VNISTLKYYIELLSYAFRNPPQAPALLKQLFYDSENRFHRHRTSEYQQYQRPTEDALAYIANASHNVLETLPPVDSLQQFMLEIREMSARDVHHIPTTWDADTTLAHLAYYACRIIRPQVVIETGVGHGITSAFILKALAENDMGHLYSIDLPAFKRGSEKFIGNAVPERLRNKWTLTLGLSGSILPGLLGKLGKIGMFLHDSDHSYHNQKTEYSLVWKYLPRGGVLLSDDINNSNAFIEFIERQKVQPIAVTQPNKNSLVGLLIKPA